MKGLTAAVVMSLSLLLGVGGAAAKPHDHDGGDRGRGRGEQARGEQAMPPGYEPRWGPLRGPPPWARGPGRRGAPPARGRYLPPPPYAARAHGRPGYARWARGQYLPSAYRGYVVEDYRRYHLRPPPYGYYWTRVGDDYLLTAAASGLIFEVIGSERY